MKSLLPAKSPHTRRLVHVLFATHLSLLVTTPSLADESVEELKTMLRAQQESIEALQAQLLAQQRSIQALEAPAQSKETVQPMPNHTTVATTPMAQDEPTLVQAPTSVEAPAEPTAPEAIEPPLSQPGLEIYGFAQADAIYDTQRMDQDWNATMRPSKIPVNCPPLGNDPGCGTNGQTIVSARQSRFGVKSLFPTPLGDLKALFEFDLFGVGASAGQTTFRLRHIWGELGQVGAGQTWSLFMDPDVFPNTIDYWGPSGMIFLRNPQLRWTPFNNNGAKMAVAIESPGSAIDQGKAQEVSPELGNSVKPRNEWPDLTTQFRLDKDWGHFQASGIVRSIGYQVTAAPGGHPSENSVGWGFNFGTGIHTFGKDLILAQVAYGEGIASYINDGGVDLGPNRYLKGQAVPLLGWLVYYDHYWNDRWSSSIGFSETWQDNTEGQIGSAFHSGKYASGNLLYRPLKNVMVGAELLWGELENYDGRSASDMRLQFSAKYNFGVVFQGSTLKSLF